MYITPQILRGINAIVERQKPPRHRRFLKVLRLAQPASSPSPLTAPADAVGPQASKGPADPSQKPGMTLAFGATRHTGRVSVPTGLATYRLIQASYKAGLPAGGC